MDDFTKYVDGLSESEFMALSLAVSSRNKREVKEKAAKLIATPFEKAMWNTKNKRDAMEMVRTRTGCGLQVAVAVLRRGAQ